MHNTYHSMVVHVWPWKNLPWNKMNIGSAVQFPLMDNYNAKHKDTCYFHELDTKAEWNNLYILSYKCTLRIITKGDGIQQHVNAITKHKAWHIDTLI